MAKEEALSSIVCLWGFAPWPLDSEICSFDSWGKERQQFTTPTVRLPAPTEFWGHSQNSPSRIEPKGSDRRSRYTFSI
jgi:hypothetical protein